MTRGLVTRQRVQRLIAFTVCVISMQGSWRGMIAMRLQSVPTTKCIAHVRTAYARSQAVSRAPLHECAVARNCS